VYTVYMESILQADIFFFVATVCMVAVSVLFGVVLIRISRGLRLLTGILETLKTQAEDIGEQSGEMLEQIRDSFIFNVLFPKKTVRKKKQKI
jgi:hypothetical protein